MVAALAEAPSSQLLVQGPDGSIVPCSEIQPGPSLDKILAIPAGVPMEQLETLFVRITLDSIVAAIPEATPCSIGCISLGYMTLSFRIGVLQLHVTKQGTQEASIGILWRPQDTDLTSIGIGPNVRGPGVTRFLREIRSSRKNNSKILLKRGLVASPQTRKRFGRGPPEDQGARGRPRRRSRVRYEPPILSAAC